METVGLVSLWQWDTRGPLSIICPSFYYLSCGHTCLSVSTSLSIYFLLGPFSRHTEETPCANVVTLLPLHIRCLFGPHCHMFIVDMGFYGWGESQTFHWSPLLHLPRASDRSNTVAPVPSNVTFKPLVGSPFARCVNSRILNNMELTSVSTEYGKGSGCFLT